MNDFLNRGIELKLEVKAYDIDAAGHVNNIVYVRWLEDLRTELMKEIFDLRKVIEAGFYIVVTSTLIRYKREIKLFDRPIGKIILSGIGHGVLMLKASIEVSSRVCTIAEQQCVLMRLHDSTILKEDELKDFMKL
ncbi:MAG: acyl-CoA thioesterase [Candidatus Kryptoniota bacterium]